MAWQWQQGGTQVMESLSYTSRMTESSENSNDMHGRPVAGAILQHPHNESINGHSSSYNSPHPPLPTRRLHEQRTPPNYNARQPEDQPCNESLIHTDQSIPGLPCAMAGAEAMQQQQRLHSGPMYTYSSGYLPLPGLSTRRISMIPSSGQDLMLGYTNQTPAVRHPYNYGYYHSPDPTQPAPTLSVSWTPSENYSSHISALRRYSCSMAPPIIAYGVPTSNNSQQREDIPLRQLDLGNATRLFVESDITFLDPLHTFLRCECIELFVVSQYDLLNPGKGSRPSKVGQVGLRCLHCKDVRGQDIAKQAVCFPSKRATLFEGVRNYQRKHFEACTHIPSSMKVKYKNLMEQDLPRKKPHKYVKVYYAEAASELGLTDTPNGLIFGSPPNKTGTPHERLSALIRAAESPAMRESFWRTYSSGMDKAIQMKKFEHVASDATRRVIVNARKEPTPYVRPQDFATTADFDFLLFHQVRPCRPTSATKLKQRALGSERVNTLSGLCCKHCVPADAEELPLKGVYFPTDLPSLTDSSFSKGLLNHLLSCNHVSREIKDAFNDLKCLSAEYGVTTKRGSKKKFLKKVWTRMEHHYK